MTQVIIFPNTDGSISVMAPALECGIPLIEIARKDVPAGVPYRIVNAQDLPQDWSFFDAWESDFSTPDGYGIGHLAWAEEQT